MRNGQHVRIRPASSIAGQYKIDPAAEGVILCQYEVLARGPSAPKRVDVRFAEGRIIWGLPVDAFEEIPDGELLEVQA